MTRENIKTTILLFCAGIVIGLGMRATEWAIPAPERKLEMHHTMDGDIACIGIRDKPAN